MSTFQAFMPRMTYFVVSNQKASYASQSLMMSQTQKVNTYNKKNWHSKFNTVPLFPRKIDEFAICFKKNVTLKQILFICQKFYISTCFHYLSCGYIAYGCCSFVETDDKFENI